LPAECRNFSGYVIDDNNGWWVDLTQGKTHSRKEFMSVKRNEAGDFTADITTTYEDYDFLEWVQTFDDHANEEAYKESLIAKSIDVDITDYHVTLDKTKLKAVEKKVIALGGTDMLNDLGSEMILNPFVLTDMDNPFKAEKRNFPIDFIYPRTRSVTMVFQIPENYSLRSVPESIVLVPEKGGARFVYRCTVMNNMLTIKCDLLILNQIYNEGEYPALRNFFVNVNSILTRPIQFDKKT
jgi:hypothetical protein